MYQFYWQWEGDKGSVEHVSLEEAQAAMSVVAEETTSPFYLAIIHDGTTVQEVSG